MDAGIFSQIIDSAMHFGDNIWQETLMGGSIGGLILLFKTRKKAIDTAVGFAVNTVNLFKKEKTEETKEAEAITRAEYGELKELLGGVKQGIGLILEQKANDYQYQLDVAGEELTPEENAKLKSEIAKSQNWLVNVMNAGAPMVLGAVTEIVQTVKEEIKDKLDDSN